MNPSNIELRAKLFLLLSVVWSALGARVCPPQEMIHPCTCRQESGVGTFLECRNILSTEELKSIFVENPMMRFQGVSILSSAMQYLPSELVDLSKFYDLHIENTTLISLFATSPKENEIQNLKIINSVIHRFEMYSYSYMRVFNNLQSLLISGVKVPSLSRFSPVKFPKSLKEIRLNSTLTGYLGYDAFGELENLEAVYVTNNPLKEVTRSIFPRPSNVSIINFDNNNISSLPLDLLEDMPNINLLSLRNNNISVLPEAVFNGTTGDELTVLVDGNPIRCNCLLKWLVDYEDVSIQGTCEKPYKGKSLQDLTHEDFGYC